jgi:LysM repeat protein
MSKWPASWRIILTIVFCGALLCGCLPMADTPLDEEKDPNFIEGRNHLNMMDYKGAVESFERAVQANPRNAAAHFELGVLYQDRMNDPVAAIYHYQKHLQLRPKSEYLEAIKPRLVACKMEIAKSVTFGVVTMEVHRDMARLTNELALARQQSAALSAQLAAKPMVVTQWMTLRVTNYVQVAVRATNEAPVIARPAATNPPTRVISPARMVQQPSATNTVRRPAVVAAPRTYVVRPGETLASIARSHGITVTRLEAANPGVPPNRVRAGQTLNLPSQ